MLRVVVCMCVCVVCVVCGVLYVYMCECECVLCLCVVYAECDVIGTFSRKSMGSALSLHSMMPSWVSEARSSSEMTWLLASSTCTSFEK